MNTGVELPESDARRRFASNKALFEAKCQRESNILPSFYSPRLHRSCSNGNTNRVNAPLPPPKPQKRSDLGFLANQYAPLVSPFAEMPSPVSEFEWRPKSTDRFSRNEPQINGPKRKAGDGGETRHEDEKNIVSDSFAYEHDRRRTSAAMSTTAENSAVEKGERQDDNSSAFQPYWRDMTFIRRKLGAEDDDVESEQQQGENEAGHHSHANDDSPSTSPNRSIAGGDEMRSSTVTVKELSGSESSMLSSVPSEPHPTASTAGMTSSSYDTPPASVISYSDVSRRMGADGRDEQPPIKFPADESLRSNGSLFERDSSRNDGADGLKQMQQQPNSGGSPFRKYLIGGSNQQKWKHSQPAESEKDEPRRFLNNNCQQKSDDTAVYTVKDGPGIGGSSEPECRSSISAASPIETMRGLSPCSEIDSGNGNGNGNGRRIKFSTAPIPVYKTYGTEYDRRNDEIDPISSCAEYELERRIEKMELFNVELDKGKEGLGVSIIGMGVGADSGLEKLGIFIKQITPGGAVERDGRIRVCDQIVSADGVSLVGVSQFFAAQVLRQTGPKVVFTIGREKNLENSEVASLIRQSLSSSANAALNSPFSPNERSPIEYFKSFPAGAAEKSQSLPSSARSVADSAAKGRSTDNEPSTTLFSSRQRRFGGGSGPPVPLQRQNATFNIGAGAISNGGIGEERDKTKNSPRELLHGGRATTASTVGAEGQKKEWQRRQQQEQRVEEEGYERQIKRQILELESELEASQRKIEHMTESLENTRFHYSKLEARFDQAREIVRSFQEREREMLKREESHVEQIRELTTVTTDYNGFIARLQSRIKELETEIKEMMQNRASIVDGELYELREKLSEMSRVREKAMHRSPLLDGSDIAGGAVAPRAASRNRPRRPSSGSEPNNCVQQQQPPIPPPDPNNQHKKQRQNSDNTRRHLQSPLANAAAVQQQQQLLEQQQFPSPRVHQRHAGLGSHLMAFSTAPPPSYNVALSDAIGAGTFILPQSPIDEQSFYEMQLRQQLLQMSSLPAAKKDAFGSNGQSPIPLISEPNSPAMSHKFLQNGNVKNARFLFPYLRKRYFQAENEFWRENVEAQGLQVLGWTVDDVCQLLMHIGLERYIPEFSINSITGPKLLDLDGSKLKEIGISNHSDRAVVKKRIKMIKSRIERERKFIEKEAKARTAMKVMAI